MAWSGVLLCDWLFFKTLSTLVEQVPNTSEIVGITTWGSVIGRSQSLEEPELCIDVWTLILWRPYLKWKSQWLMLRKPKSLCMLFRLNQQGSLCGGRRKLFKKSTYVSSENTDLFIWKIGSTFTHLPCSEFKVWYPWPSTVAGKPP